MSGFLLYHFSAGVVSIDTIGDRFNKYAAFKIASPHISESRFESDSIALAFSTRLQFNFSALPIVQCDTLVFTPFLQLTISVLTSIITSQLIQLLIKT
jgi:hypothetical protein